MLEGSCTMRSRTPWGRYERADVCGRTQRLETNTWNWTPCWLREITAWGLQQACPAHAVHSARFDSQASFQEPTDSRHCVQAQVASFFFEGKTHKQQVAEQNSWRLMKFEFHCTNPSGIQHLWVPAWRLALPNSAAEMLSICKELWLSEKKGIRWK